MKPVLVFDIETIPDVPGLRRLHGLDASLSDTEVAELAFQQISELLPVPGIEIVGPLPDAIQQITVFSAGVPANALAPEAAQAFLRYLVSTAAAGAIRQSGLSPMNTKNQ